MATFENPVASSSPEFEPQSATQVAPAEEPTNVSPETDEYDEDAAKQRAEDLKFKTDNPNVPRARAANPKVGGESF